VALDDAGEDAVGARADGRAELVDALRLAPHEAADDALVVAERRDAEQPHRAAGQRVEVATGERLRLRRPPPVEHRAPDDHHVVGAHVEAGLDGAHVHVEAPRRNPAAMRSATPRVEMKRVA
jgi:hypothetical protein